MKNKFKISHCLTILLITSTTHPYQKSLDCEEKTAWQKMTARITAFFYGKKAASKKVKNQDPIVVKPIKNLSRQQALDEIKKVTTSLFDPKDNRHISLHLNEMKELSNFLHEIEDKKLIAAIHFLLENHHKSSVTYLAFWIQATQRLELDTIIPMTPKIASLPKAEKLAILRKKMTISS